MTDQDQLCIKYDPDAVDRRCSTGELRTSRHAHGRGDDGPRHLRHHPKNPAWPDRDRFVLSAGHASALYRMLFLTGYDVAMEDLEQFRQWKSRTPGHPERGCTPGVEVNAGRLGEGFGNVGGMARACRRDGEGRPEQE